MALVQSKATMAILQLQQMKVYILESSLSVHVCACKASTGNVIGSTILHWPLLHVSIVSSCRDKVAMKVIQQPQVKGGHQLSRQYKQLSTHSSLKHQRLLQKQISMPYAQM